MPLTATAMDGLLGVSISATLPMALFTIILWPLGGKLSVESDRREASKPCRMGIAGLIGPRLGRVASG
jgi:hypothetical protein